jgi:hypothetical protein
MSNVGERMIPAWLIRNVHYIFNTKNIQEHENLFKIHKTI